MEGTMGPLKNTYRQTQYWTIGVNNYSFEYRTDNTSRKGNFWPNEHKDGNTYLRSV